MAALLGGKSAAITGGVTGIGRAIALGYLRHGAAVTVNFLDDAPSRKHFESLKAEAPTGSKLHGVTGDIGRKATGEAIVKGAVEVHGSLDVFVANAGVSQFRDFVTSSDSTRRRLIPTFIPTSRERSGRRKQRHDR
jgi:L-rhamnose 1-dehydrogenase